MEAEWASEGILEVYSRLWHRVKGIGWEKNSVPGVDLGELETFSKQLWGLASSSINGAVTLYYTIILTNQLSVYVYVHMCVSACTHVYVFVCNF